MYPPTSRPNNQSGNPHPNLLDNLHNNHPVNQAGFRPVNRVKHHHLSHHDNQSCVLRDNQLDNQLDNLRVNQPSNLLVNHHQNPHRLPASHLVNRQYDLPNNLHLNLHAVHRRNHRCSQHVNHQNSLFRVLRCNPQVGRLIVNYPMQSLLLFSTLQISIAFTFLPTCLLIVSLLCRLPFGLSLFCRFCVL